MTLVLRDEQLRQLERGTRRVFRQRLVEHVERVFPDLCRELGAGEVRRRVARGHRRAVAREISRERNVALFVDLFFGLGPEVESNAEHAWVAALLDDPALSEDGKMTLIYQRLRRRGRRTR